MGTIDKRQIEESLAMLAGDVVCDRREYGAAPFPEPYSGRALLNPGENPVLRIPKTWRVSFVNKRRLAVN